MSRLRGNRIVRWALVAVVVGGLAAASYFVGVSVGDDSDEVRALKDQLTAEADRVEQAQSQLDDLNTELEEARAEVEKVTGAEESVEDPASGLNAKIVSKGKTLTLEEIAVTLLGHQTSEAISSDIDTVRAEGIFVTVTVRLQNRTNSPQTPPDADAYLLEIGGDQFNASFDAMNLPGQSFVWNDEPISPGTARTGTITFDVSAGAAKKAATGTLFVPQFSDAGSLDEGTTLPVAGLKLR